MADDSQERRRRRRLVRLKGFDYARAGAYYVTICVREKWNLFGEIVGGEMRLTDVGRMVAQWYQELENKFPDIRIDAFVVMPNHVHFIVVNMGDGTDESGEHAGSPLRAVVQWFKTMTTNEYIRRVKTEEWRPFPGQLWQRNYYEHIIRNDRDWNRIRAYIRENPERWDQDEENPLRND